MLSTNKGWTRFLLSEGPLDEDIDGVEVDLQAGNVVVDPAGVAHCSLESSDDFEYVGVFAEVSAVCDASILYMPAAHYLSFSISPAYSS